MQKALDHMEHPFKGAQHPQQRTPVLRGALGKANSKSTRREAGRDA